MCKFNTKILFCLTLQDILFNKFKKGIYSFLATFKKNNPHEKNIFVALYD